MLYVFTDTGKYELFESVQVVTTLDSICGKFKFTTSLLDKSPFGIGSYVVIKNEYDLILCSGYIEKTDGAITKEKATVTFSGRDLLGDLVDSSVPPDVSSFSGSITLEKLCDNVMGALNLPGTTFNMSSPTEPFNQDDISSTTFSGKAGAFLQSYARKRQKFLTTDGKNNLVLFSAPSSPEYEKTLTKDSMLARSFSFDTTQRFNKITLGSEDNYSASDNASSVDSTASFIDSEIRESRILQIESDESMTSSEISNRAKEEVTIRRGRGTQFSCVVPSHNYVKGKLIKVDDELTGVEGVFLIKSVTYSSSVKENVSKLDLCYPEVYEAVGTRTTKRKSKIVENFDKFDPSNVPGVIQGFDGWTMLDSVEGAQL